MRDEYNFNLSVDNGPHYDLVAQPEEEHSLGADTTPSYSLEHEDLPEYGLESESTLDYSIRLNEAIRIIRDGGGSIFYDTTQNWNLAPQTIAEQAAIYIYSDRNVYEDEVGNPIFVPGIKVGDGSSYLIDLPFVDENVIRALANHVADTTRHITQAERIFWNNKVSSYMDSVDGENLILSKTNYVLED